MSRSKNQYQGMNLQRVHRSELDDSKRRDLARHDARLGEDLKTVERARHVMMKSHESDKLLFIKSGGPSNIKVNKNTPGPNFKSNTQSYGGHSRFVQDTKIKRSSFADQGDVDGPPANGTNGPLRSDRLGPTEHTPGTAEASYYDTTSVYDRFFEANTGIAAPKRGSKTFTDEGAVKPSAHPTRTNEPLSSVTATAHTTNGVHGNKDAAMAAERINPPSQLKQGMEETDSENERREAVTDREYTQETKRPSIWETLSVPKHMSTVKSKRSQVEREFSRPLPSAAVKNGKPAGGQRLLLQDGSEKKSIRQTGIPKGRTPSDKRIRNDT
ncbi:unnamed protein product [Lymnaea stagnalis]|uniref:Uncharacterized protein n=1 Tax=Lymnaea stagnalis TaxID=6523 RepID=A0AAV2HQ04_LYMST